MYAECVPHSGMGERGQVSFDSDLRQSCQSWRTVVSARCGASLAVQSTI